MTILRIDRLSHDLRGMAQADGLVWFVENALPGETVQVRELARHAQRVDAVAEQVLGASDQRTQPACEYYGQCGGCDTQHITHEAQLALKQQVLLQQLQRLGNVRPADLLPPLLSAPFAYRRRARLACRWLGDKKQLRVGLRERHRQQVVEIAHCAVLEPRLQALLQPLRALLSGWSQPRELGHVELLAADNGVAVLLRLLREPVEKDRLQLQQWGSENGVAVFLQCGDDKALLCLQGETALQLVHRDSGAVLQCVPGDFVQGNGLVNVQLIDAVLAALVPQAADRVLEAFCGLGNFTLPLAARVAQIAALELDAGMLARARAQAVAQHHHNIVWRSVDLQRIGAADVADGANKILLDPPRDGAQAFCRHVSLKDVERMVYVSCNPSTLARDAAILAERGFALSQLQLVDMFPQTSHIEVLAVFVPQQAGKAAKKKPAAAPLKRLRR